MTYVVSDADIFVVGNNAEHLWEPARNFQQVELKLDGQSFSPPKISTSPTGPFCLNTPAEVPTGTHTLELEARVAGKTMTVSNPALKIDNKPPTAILSAIAPYSSHTQTVQGEASDEHSGMKGWQLELQPAGGSWQPVCGRDADATGRYPCDWDTTGWADGSYRLRAKGVDHSSDDGNSGYSTESSTFVDNTDPTLSISGGLKDREDGHPIFEDERPPLFVSSSDVGGSGVERIELYVDGVRRDGAQQSCAGCGLSHTFSFDPTAYATGDHTVRFVAQDQAGRAREASWSVFVMRNPPDSADESATDPVDEDPPVEPGSSAPMSATLGVGMASSADAAEVGEPPTWQALATATELQCDSDDIYRVFDHLDYGLPLDGVGGDGLGTGSPTPQLAVVEYLASAANLPPIAPTLFGEETAVGSWRVFSVRLDGLRQAWLAVLPALGGGWEGTYFGGCSRFINELVWLADR